MMNPLYELQIRLIRTPITELIEWADNYTETRFCDECVKYAQDHENLTEVRKLAQVAFRWWNP